MTVPGDELSKRTIAVIAVAIIAATALTIEGTYLILKAYVLDNPNDPLTKAGGLSPVQDPVKAKGNDRLPHVRLQSFAIDPQGDSDAYSGFGDFDDCGGFGSAVGSRPDI